MNKVKIMSTVVSLYIYSVRPKSHEQGLLTNSQALCDIDCCTKRVPCNTRVAPTFSCFVLFSTGNLSPSFFIVPFDVGFRVPIHWTCKRFHNSSNYQNSFSFICSLNRIFKGKNTQQKAAINWLNQLQLIVLLRYLGIIVHRRAELTQWLENWPSTNVTWV